jgi:hypothetical protein
LRKQWESSRLGPGSQTQTEFPNQRQSRSPLRVSGFPLDRATKRDGKNQDLFTQTGTKCLSPSLTLKAQKEPGGTHLNARSSQGNLCPAKLAQGHSDCGQASYHRHLPARAPPPSDRQPGRGLGRTKGTRRAFLPLPPTTASKLALHKRKKKKVCSRSIKLKQGHHLNNK